MRFSGTLARSVVGEVLLFAALGLFGVAAVLLGQNLLRELADLAGVGLTGRDLLGIALALSGVLAGYVIPVAFVFGALVTVARISADGEVLALRSLGIGLGALIVPVLLCAGVASGLTWLLLNEVEPQARRALRGVAADVAARGALLEPGRFRRLDRAGRRLALVDARDPDNALHGVFIADRSDPQRPFTVAAERGRFSFDPETARATLRLEAGDIHFGTRDDGDVHRRIAFQSFDYAWDLSELLGAQLHRLRPRELDNEQLHEALDHFASEDAAPAWAREKNRHEYAAQLERRRAMPFAPLVLALLAVPLGLRRTRGARSFGLIAGVVLLLVYYLLDSTGVALVIEGRIPAWLGLWLANAVFALVAIPLLWRAGRAES